MNNDFTKRHLDIERKIGFALGFITGVFAAGITFYLVAKFLFNEL